MVGHVCCQSSAVSISHAWMLVFVLHMPAAADSNLHCRVYGVMVGGVGVLQQRGCEYLGLNSEGNDATKAGASMWPK
jgi:hypothetical protein